MGPEGAAATGTLRGDRKISAVVKDLGVAKEKKRRTMRNADSNDGNNYAMTSSGERSPAYSTHSCDREPESLPNSS